MISHPDTSPFSLLLRKSIINPRAILQTCHKNCMYNTDKSFHEVSTQCQQLLSHCTDEQTQVSQSNESKDTQTCYVYPLISMKNPRRMINPYSIIDRVNQGEEFLKFLSQQNQKLDFIYTKFLKHLQRYTDRFLLSLEQEHGLYGTYRDDMIRYTILLQDHINELQTKVNILQESNKNFALFQKHFHKLIRRKSPLEDYLHKQNKPFKQMFSSNEPMKSQQHFFEIYRNSSIQLRTVEQQRLLAIRDQMRFAIHLTIGESNLFTSNNFDDLLNTWEHQNTVSIDRRSEHDIPSNLLAKNSNKKIRSTLV